MEISVMKRTVLAISLLCGFLPVIGCGQKTANTQSQIDQAVQSMARATSPAPAAADSAVPPTPLQQMNDAVASYKAGDFEAAVTRFQTIRAHTAMTGDQLLALNNALGAVMSDLYTRAAKGDAAAGQAVKQYEQMQTQRR
jgi:hypothetical protein